MEAEEEHEETKLYNPDDKMKAFMDSHFKEFASAMFKQNFCSKCSYTNACTESNNSNPFLPGTHIKLKILYMKSFKLSLLADL